MKKILEENNMLYITDGNIVRIIHLKTGNAKETDNKSILKKVIEKGAKEIESSGKY